MLIYGINPVLEALRAGRVKELRVARARGRTRAPIWSTAAERAGVPVRRVGAGRARSCCRAAACTRAWSRRLADARAVRHRRSRRPRATGAPLIVVLDGIEDPHNVGAILRTVDAAGADGVVRQSRHAAPLDGAAAKASAGAVSHVKVADVVNIARALEELKERGRLDGRPGRRRAEAVRRDRSHAADGRGRGRRRDGAAAAGAGAVRLAGVDPDARARREPERVGGDRNRAVRRRLGSVRAARAGAQRPR